MADVKELIRQARRVERTHEVCLRGDLAAELERLERQARESRANGKLDDGSGALAKQIEDVRAQMRDATLTVTLRALRSDRYRSLQASHPARTAPKPSEWKQARENGRDDLLDGLRRREADAKVDEPLGVNGTTFFPALVRECLVDPVLDDEDWEGLLDGLTDRQWDDLALAAYNANRGEVSVPFSRTVSKQTPS